MAKSKNFGLDLRKKDFFFFKIPTVLELFHIEKKDMSEFFLLFVKFHTKNQQPQNIFLSIDIFNDDETDLNFR